MDRSKKNKNQNMMHNGDSNIEKVNNTTYNFKTKNKSDMSRRKKSILPWILGILMLMLGLNGYQWFENNKLKKAFTHQTSEFEEVKLVSAQLDKDYETAIESLEEMRGDNIELNELIDNQKTELAAQKKKIKQLIWTKRELKKAKKEIVSINELKDQYIAEVNQLKAKIENLELDNGTLRDKNTELVGTIAEEQEAKALVIEAKDVLTKENKGLNKQVDMANAIKVNFMEVTGYKENSSGKLKKKRRAKNIHILRTCFRTETNMVTPGGQKNFKIRIVDPLGTTLYNEQLGSGTVTDKLSGHPVKYTLSGDIQYDNEDTNACIDYRPSNPLARGEYTVEMFNNGFLVGKGNFKLK